MKDKAKSIIVISRVLLWLFIVSMAVLVISN